MALFLLLHLFIQIVAVLIMSREPSWEKSSCLWKLKKHKMFANDVCSACSNMKDHTRRYFITHKDIPFKGVCHLLYPHLEPQQQDKNSSKTQGDQNNEVDADKENKTRPNRKIVPIDKFEACPSNGAHQKQFDRPDAVKLKMRLRESKRIKSSDLLEQIRINPRRRKSFLAAATNNATLNVPTNGKSKAAISKAEKTYGEVGWNAVRMLLPEHVTKSEKVSAFEKLRKGVNKKYDHLIASKTPEHERRNANTGNDTPTIRFPTIQEDNEENAYSPQDLSSSQESPLPTPGGTVKKRRRIGDENPFSSEETSASSPQAQAQQEETAKKRPKKRKGKAAKIIGQVATVKETLGTATLNRLKELKTPAERRPYLAQLFETNHIRAKQPTKKAAEMAVGIKYCCEEWNKIKIHAKWPGPMKPVETPEISRHRVPE